MKTHLHTGRGPLFTFILRVLTAVNLSALIISCTVQEPSSILKYEARISYSPNDDKMEVAYVDPSDGVEKPMEAVSLAPGDQVTVTINNTKAQRLLGKWKCYWWWDHSIEKDDWFAWPEKVHSPIEQLFSRHASLGKPELKVYVESGPETKRVKKELSPFNSKRKLGPYLGTSNLEVAAAIDRKPPTQNECKPNKSPLRWRGAPKEIEKAEAGRWFTVSITVYKFN